MHACQSLGIGLPYIPVKINHNIIPSRSKYLVSTAILNSPSLLCFVSSLVFALLTQSGGAEISGKDAGMGAGRLIGNSDDSGTDTFKLSLSLTSLVSSSIESFRLRDSLGFRWFRNRLENSAFDFTYGSKLHEKSLAVKSNTWILKTILVFLLLQIVSIKRQILCELSY